ncbi:c-type cytochrome [Pseudoruegeria sp. SHC-113]|uniref:c-type cytochrome n=1 Tax=Pseudoruegeria sp. SHC-113 TaxID=2855439 RepID=UPI0021BB504F|nr:cytochrome c [Pseudoruegeria sp. SHC-113]MCT8160968.1 cytochrome c [Pseudoruegeria sp. SHC-113]
MNTGWIPLLLALAGPLQAQDMVEGHALYTDYCARCHGDKADGMGPLAASLNPQPSDLTALAAGNEGRFPVARVAARIDGRDPLVAHGSPMPVYGDFFEGQDAVIKAETGQPVFTSQPVVDLIAYLQSLQR